MRLRLAAILAASAALAGCLEGADASLPGVRLDSTVTDAFGCDPLLLAADGCPVVRAEAVASGCAPESPGYVVCDAALNWSATGGSAGSRLVTAINGTAGAGCAPAAANPCRVPGRLEWRRAFGKPGEAHWWNVTLDARVLGPEGRQQGWFALDVRMRVRTEPLSAVDA